MRRHLPPRGPTGGAGQMCADCRAEQESNCISLQSVELKGQSSEGFIVVGMGRQTSKRRFRQPQAACSAALERNRSYRRADCHANPDPYLRRADG